MTRLVVLQPAANADQAAGYDVRLGPLAFVCLAAPAGETLGESLDNVGAVLTPAEPRPRPFKLSLPIRGSGHDGDPRANGYRLRRQFRQLLENSRWRNQGLYFHFGADTELNGWLLVGGGDLNADDPAIVLGEWTLELSDCYVVGKPAAQRLARRLELADRRSGLVPLDTRAMLFSTDHADQPLPPRPLIVPGDVASVLLTRNRPPAAQALGPQRDSRRLWLEVSGLDGDVASFIPNEAILTDRPRQYLDLEDVGAVRVWDTSRSSVDVRDPANWTATRDANPVLMGWERVLGSPLERDTPLAIDNGICRLVWLGNDANGGLALEYLDAGLAHYVRLGRISGNDHDAATEATVVELTLERAVIEWRGGARAYRAILQRGWYGPRLEAYNDAGGDAALEYVPDALAPATGASAPAWVDTLTAGGDTLLWAKGTDADARTNVLSMLNGAGVRYSHPLAIVAQLGPPPTPSPDELASLAVADAQSVPVLVSR